MTLFSNHSKLLFIARLLTAVGDLRASIGPPIMVMVSGVVSPREAEELAGPPAGMAAAGGEEALDQRLVDGSRRAMRASRLIGKGGPAAGVIAGEPLVAGLAADPVGGAELGDRDGLALGILDKLLTERHRGLLVPRHRTS